MHLILLKTAEITDPPEGVEVLDNFGPETIIVGHTFIEGEALYVSGEPKALAAWLHPYDGVWMTDNPMAGHWQIWHIRDESL